MSILEKRSCRLLTLPVGGANGIGAATVEVFYAQGTLIVFGDTNEKAGRDIAAKYDSKRVHFLLTDVTKYGDNLALFQFAFKEFGRVDHAISIAGVLEQGNIFDPSLTIESVQEVRSCSLQSIIPEAWFPR